MASSPTQKRWGALLDGIYAPVEYVLNERGIRRMAEAAKEGRLYASFDYEGKMSFSARDFFLSDAHKDTLVRMLFSPQDHVGGLDFIRKMQDKLGKENLIALQQKKKEIYRKDGRVGQMVYEDNCIAENSKSWAKQHDIKDPCVQVVVKLWRPYWTPAYAEIVLEVARYKKALLDVYTEGAPKTEKIGEQLIARARKLKLGRSALGELLGGTAFGMAIEATNLIPQKMVVTILSAVMGATLDAAAAELEIQSMSKEIELISPKKE